MNLSRQSAILNFLFKYSMGVFLLMSMPALSALSQVQEPVPVVKPNYAQAERYSSRYLRQFVYDSSVRPNWIGESDEFWYSFRTSAGTKYYRVDPKHATKEDLFDHGKLASLLSELIRKPLDSTSIPLTRVEIDDDGTSIKFVVDKFQYEYDLDEEELVKLGKAPAATSRSRFGGRTRQVEEEKKEEEKDEKTDKDKDVKDKKITEVKEEKSKTDSKEKNKDAEKDSSDKADKSTDTKDEKKTGDESDKNQDDKKVRENKQSEKTQVDEKSKGKNRKGEGETDEKGDSEGKSGKAKTDEGKEKPQTNHRAFSPDRTAYVYTKGHDLYFVEIPEDYEYESSDSKKSDDVKKDKDEKSQDGSEQKDKTEDGEDEEDRDEDGKKEDGKKEDGADKDGGKNKDQKEDKTDTQKKVKTDSKEKDSQSKDGEKGDDEEDEDKELPIPEIGPELDETAIRLTEDGEEKFSFAFRSRRRGSRSTGSTSQEDVEKAKTRKTRPNVTWSKDSKAFFVSRRDSRKVKELFVINSLSAPRPTLEKYAYSMPGEEEVSISHFHYFSRENKEFVELEKKWKHESIRSAHWKKEGHQLRFVRSDRLLRNVEFCELDIATGESTCLIEDGFEAANISVQSVRYLKETDEMIWFSERSGWAHFYLYDLDGNLKNPITSGEFRASRIVDIDEENRLVYFTGNAREEGENVYQNHLYCIRLDGTGLTLLDPGNANHRSTLSPSKKYIVDNCSRVDMVPISVLRDSQGKEIMKLEESDVSRLKEVGWKLPETFVVKAADGVTDLYGNIWKPFDFNPNRKYPIIAHVYPGPQMEGTSHTFSATAGNQQLAQLGFIVIQVGHRGGTPQRSKAYHSYGYFNLRDYGLADKKAAIEQLGQRFKWVDVERVGIYGHSGGGFMTAAALLREPYNDFFKVGVSTAGNHDNNIYNSSWSERYHGLKEVPVEDKKTASKSQQTTTARSGRRSGAPEMASDYAAFDSEESDFFFENEGFLNQEGDLEFSSDHDLYDGPRAFQRQDDEKVDEDSETKKVVNDGDDKSDENSETEEKDDEKSEQSKKEKEGKSESKDKAKKKTRFEIEVPTNAELAENLKGHLFLVHGEADNNVHPANTLRLVDALIKANKRFDMLYLPATRHGFGRYQPYVTQRMYEYFAEHLLNDYQSDADMENRE